MGNRGSDVYIFYISCFFKFLQALHESLYRVETGNYDYRYNFAFISIAPCKRTQHCWLTIPNIVGCYMLYPFAHPVACCCVLLGVVAQSLKPVKCLSKQLPTFVLFCDGQSMSNNVGSVCTALPTLFTPRTCITHGLQSLMGCILSKMHSGSNIVGSCCICFPSTTNKDATTRNIVGKVHE